MYERRHWAVLLRVLTVVEIADTEKEGVLCRHSGIYYCDTLMTLHAHDTESGMRTWLESQGDMSSEDDKRSLVVPEQSKGMTESNGRMEELMLADEPEFRHVMECVFDIRNHESQTYLVLLDVPGSTAAELAEDLNRDPSNANRSLTTLVEKGLVERERRLLDSGGHVYQYTAVPLPEAREQMHEAVEKWSEQVHERISEFGSTR